MAILQIYCSATITRPAGDALLFFELDLANNIVNGLPSWDDITIIVKAENWRVQYMFRLNRLIFYI
jgi:hypothetical protein